MKLTKMTSALMALTFLASCGQDKNLTINSPKSNTKIGLAEMADSEREAQESFAPYASRVKMLDRMTFTLSTGQKLDGPYFLNTDEGKNTYGSIYLKTLLQEAHKVASKYLAMGDEKAYYSFMVMALTVPLHEGLWMHFVRTTDEAGVCNPYVQSGKTLINPKEEDYYAMSPEALKERQEAVQQTYLNFYKSLKSGKKPFLANCDDLRNVTDIMHIIRGYDGSDIGAMQLSIRWHLDEFFALEEYKSLRKTFKYGLNFIERDSFSQLYKVASMNKPQSKFEKKLYKETKGCLLEGGFFSRKKEFSYENLIRGSWAGKYNSGSVFNACRFEKRDSKHDIGFYKNLNKVYNFLLKEKVGYMDDLSFKVDSEVKGALDEVICNFNTKVSAISKGIENKDERASFESEVASKCSSVLAKNNRNLKNLLK